MKTRIIEYRTIATILIVITIVNYNDQYLRFIDQAKL